MEETTTCNHPHTHKSTHLLPTTDVADVNNRPREFSSWKAVEIDTSLLKYTGY